ncbi:MAG: hypothetical protein Q9166_007129 [cf. Caloplaca sp. 2 TL-2023]
MKRENMETPNMYRARTFGMKMPTEAVAKRPPISRENTISATARLFAHCENEDGGVVKQDTKGHSSEGHSCHDRGKASSERVEQDWCRDPRLREGRGDDKDDASYEKDTDIWLFPTNRGCLIPRKGKKNKTGNEEKGANVVELLEIESRNKRANTMWNNDIRRNTKDKGVNGPEPETPLPGNLLSKHSTNEATENITWRSTEAEESESDVLLD